jgi:hypothetical protein
MHATRVAKDVLAERRAGRGVKKKPREGPETAANERLSVSGKMAV